MLCDCRTSTNASQLPSLLPVSLSLSASLSFCTPNVVAVLFGTNGSITVFWFILNFKGYESDTESEWSIIYKNSVMTQSADGWWTLHIPDRIAQDCSQTVNEALQLTDMRRPTWHTFHTMAHGITYALKAVYILYVCYLVSRYVHLLQ